MEEKKEDKNFGKMCAFISLIGILIIVLSIWINNNFYSSSTANTDKQAVSEEEFLSEEQGVSEKQSAEEKVTYTLEEIAKKSNSRIGEFNKTFRLDTKYTYDDGSYMLLSIKKVYLRGNDIVLNTALPIDKINQMLSKTLIFETWDEYGNRESDIGVSTEVEKDESTNIVLSGRDLPNYKYLVLGPTAGDIYNIIFEISKG